MIGVQATSLSSMNPPLTGFTYKSQTSMPEKSTLLNVYQDAAAMETRYLPAQALQNCFRYFWFSLKKFIVHYIVASATLKKRQNIQGNFNI